MRTMPSPSCRHGHNTGEFAHDTAQACREGLRKGAPYWLVKPKRVQLPPAYKLPYLGNWTPSTNHTSCALPLNFNARNG